MKDGISIEDRKEIVSRISKVIATLSEVSEIFERNNIDRCSKDVYEICRSLNDMRIKASNRNIRFTEERKIQRPTEKAFPVFKKKLGEAYRIISELDTMFDVHGMLIARGRFHKMVNDIEDFSMEIGIDYDEIGE